MAASRSGASRPERFILREVQPKDLPGLFELSRHLDSVNFPHDRRVLQAVIAKARRSFLGKQPDPADQQFMFVLEGAQTKRIVGTSTIFAQHGSKEAPHIFFDAFQDEHYSYTLDRHFKHTTLRLGFEYQGPTEIGALVLDPAYRAGGLGRALSFVRFLFIAMYRSCFRDEVLAELMPPLTAEGRSRLWDHVGKRFTGLDYQEADKLSHTNKEFITALFPQAIHATLLPDDVAALVGEVGEQTKGVRRMLQEIGFRYSQRIDPFDGGPHFHALTDQITLVRDARSYSVAKGVVDADEEANLLSREAVPGLIRALVGVGRPGFPSRFRALVCGVRSHDGALVLSEAARGLLKLRTNAEAWAVRF